MLDFFLTTGVRSLPTAIFATIMVWISLAIIQAGLRSFSKAIKLPIYWIVLGYFVLLFSLLLILGSQVHEGGFIFFFGSIFPLVCVPLAIFFYVISTICNLVVHNKPNKH